MKRRGNIAITFMSGALDGKTLHFPQPHAGEQRILTVGRREGCDIHLPFDNQVSRLHARIGCQAKVVTSSDDSQIPPMLAFWLEDGGSRNGTFLEYDSEPIEKRVTLRPGALFRIGRTWLRLDVPMSFNF